MPKSKLGRPASTSVRYRSVAAELRQRIERGEWQPGAVLPSIRSLARTLGVGKGIVGLAIEALKAQNFLAVNVHRRLVVKSRVSDGRVASGMILEVLSSSFRLSMGSSYARELQAGIERGTGDLMAPLLIAHSSHWQDAVPTDLAELSLRGVVLVGHFTDDVLRFYERLNVPAVLVDHPGADWKMHAVAVDNVNAAADATRRLVALGHRRIVFVRRVSLLRREVETDSRERQEGVERALKEAGVRLKASAVFNITPRDNAASSVFKAILESHPRFTAAVTADPGVAGSLIEAARVFGRNVPRELSVVTFQGLPSTPTNISGPWIDFYALGRYAVGLLKREKKDPAHLRFKSAWHPGETVAPPSSK